MNFEPSRAQATNKLDNFVENNLSESVSYTHLSLPTIYSV